MLAVPNTLQPILDEAIAAARRNVDGSVSSYIPELAIFPEEYTSVALRFADGSVMTAGDDPSMLLTVQSVSKVALLIGMLEEFKEDQVFSWVRMEPSGDDFASVAWLDQFGPIPYNPMLNAGAISLCSHVPGETPEEKIHWLEHWMEKCFGQPLNINHKVFTSERRTGDRNRSLAYLMKSNRVITGSIKEILEVYFCSCAFETNVTQASYLSFLLANRGCSPSGERVMSIETVRIVVSILATCGLYNESGRHLVRTGMPAKSSVSGLTIAIVPNKVGIAVASPRVNGKGNSIRAEIILEFLAKKMNWYFIDG